MAEWRFYGRTTELDALTTILRRNRWFFAKITGRRRIGKTTLVQQAITARGSAPIVYVQIPDSGDAGVLSTFVDALETFGILPEPCVKQAVMQAICGAARRARDVDAAELRCPQNLSSSRSAGHRCSRK